VDPRLIDRAQTDTAAIRGAVAQVAAVAATDLSAPFPPRLAPGLVSAAPSLLESPPQPALLAPPAFQMPALLLSAPVPARRVSTLVPDAGGTIMTAGLLPIDDRIVAEVIDGVRRWSRNASRGLEHRMGRLLGSDAESTGNLPGILEGQSETAVVAAFQSPTGARRTVTLVTAGTPEILERDVRQLVKPALWQRVSGDLVTWNAAAPVVETRTAAEPFLLGDVPDDWRQRLLYLDSILARDPVLWSVLAFFGLFGMAGLTWAGLLIRDRRA
jgi:hypothetical protein